MSKLGPDERPGYKTVGVIDGYNKWAATYDLEHNPLITLEEPVTLELIGDVLGQRVLDLGCGTGRYCVRLVERGATVVGVDPSTEMLKRARRKITPRCHFELCHGTIQQADFPDEQFDLVISALALSHLPQLAPTLREAVRVLKPGGRMIISDIHPFWPVSGHDYTEFYDGTGQEYRLPEYPHLIEEYWQLFNKFGMQLVDIRESKIEAWLIEHFPNLEAYQGVPLAIVLKAKRDR